MKKNIYLEFKEEQQNKINKLPIYWAFGQEQLNELMEKLNIKNDDELKEKCFGIFGGLALKEDKQLIINTFKQNNEELKERLKNDDFLRDALEYELANHEYIITFDITDALDVLGITHKEYQTNKRINKIVKEAIKNYKEDMEKLGW